MSFDQNAEEWICFLNLLLPLGLSPDASSEECAGTSKTEQQHTTPMPPTSKKRKQVGWFYSHDYHAEKDDA